LGRHAFDILIDIQKFAMGRTRVNVVAEDQGVEFDKDSESGF
jgi:hypothetical protein